MMMMVWIERVGGRSQTMYIWVLEQKDERALVCVLWTFVYQRRALVLSLWVFLCSPLSLSHSFHLLVDWSSYISHHKSHTQSMCCECSLIIVVYFFGREWPRDWPILWRLWFQNSAGGNFEFIIQKTECRLVTESRLSFWVDEMT